jgi:hypothetical protein
MQLKNNKSLGYDEISVNLRELYRGEDGTCGRQMKRKNGQIKTDSNAKADSCGERNIRKKQEVLGKTNLPTFPT